MISVNRVVDVLLMVLQETMSNEHAMRFPFVGSAILIFRRSNVTAENLFHLFPMDKMINERNKSFEYM